MIRHADSRALDEAAERLRSGELVAFPTETVYGLGANAWNPAAVAKIFAAKGRPSTNPLIVHVASIDQLGLAAALPLDADRADWLAKLQPFWPGPLTIVVPRRPEIPETVTAGLMTVGVRIPAHPVALELLRRCEFPIAAPSANRSNYVSPTRAEHVERDLGPAVGLILDGGPCDSGVESTIVTLVDEPPRLLRLGSLPVERIAEALGVSAAVLLRPGVREPSDREVDVSIARESPGQMPEHYAPRTPLRLAPQGPVDDWPARVGWIEFRRGSAAGHGVTRVITLSTNGDFDQVARGLFAALRELDDEVLDLIVVDRCDEQGLGRAIMDRVRRAVGRG